jgi:hypothetical protein
LGCVTSWRTRAHRAGFSAEPRHQRAAHPGEHHRVDRCIPQGSQAVTAHERDAVAQAGALDVPPRQRKGFGAQIDRNRASGSAAYHRSDRHVPMIRADIGQKSTGLNGFEHCLKAWR